MLQVRTALLLFSLVLPGPPAASTAPATPSAVFRASVGPAAASRPRRKPPRRGAAPPLAAVERSRTLMGATCTAMAEGRSDSTATARALDEALDEIARLEDVMSMERNTSEITRLNAAAGERFTCSSDLYAVIDSAMGVAGESDGFYDPTIEPFNRAWDVRGEGRVPPADEIGAARTLVGWRTVYREPRGSTVRLLHPGMAIDLDDIGRGYALERLAGVLRERGIARALVAFGGEILAVSNREPWQVTVEGPGEQASPAVRLALTNGALATAVQRRPGNGGDDGRHTLMLEPRTGMPLLTEASVSVVARSATRAAALSSALLVMGRERAAAFTAAHGGLGVLWLEPGEDGLRAWAWNLPSVAAEPGVNIRWMSRP